MIPKTIHYCWFGNGEKNKTIQKCINSWKKKCPDYKIIEWNESTFDVNCHPFVKAAYEDKNWAFVSDYVRLYALKRFGGVYVDTDVQLLKGIDKFLNHKMFTGFENSKNVNTGLIFGAEKECDFLKRLLQEYDNIVYVPNSVDFHMKNTNTERTTKLLIKKGLEQNNQFQVVDDIAIYPSDFFCPLDVNTFLLHKTKNTVSIHWYEGSWTSDRYKEWKKGQIKRNKADKIKYLPQRIVRKIFGNDRIDRIKEKHKN